MLVSSQRHCQHTAFSGFPLGGTYGQGILPVSPLEFQRKKHQPFSPAQPCIMPCHGIWLMQCYADWLHCLFQRDLLAGRRWKAPFKICLELREIEGSVIGCGCFISAIRWKIQPFSPVSPLAGATDKAFCRLSLWSFREKSINHFLEHNQNKRPAIVSACFISTLCWEYRLFL